MPSSAMPCAAVSFNVSGRDPITEKFDGWPLLGQKQTRPFIAPNETKKKAADS
jgi:hypothetical protein